MSCLPNQTNITPKDAFFLLANASTFNAGNLNVNNLSCGTITAGQANIQTGFYSTLRGDLLSANTLHVSSIISDGKIDANVFSSIFTYAFEGTVSTLFTEHIILDQATLDVVGGNVLLLNGIPLATTSTSISSLEEWSYYPALSSLNMASQNIANCGNLNSQNIFNALAIQTDSLAALTNLTSPAATLTNLRATNFSTVNLVASNATIPSLTAGAGAFSTLNTSSIFTSSVRGSAGVFSTLNVSSINNISTFNAQNWANYPATSNVNMNGFDITGGSQTSFNINGNINMTLTASNSISTVVDRGIDITAPAIVNINAKNGLQGQVNIQADPGFAGVFGRVDITANGGTTGGIGTGGLITLNANTPIGFSNATSAIRMNAAGINSYAGLIPSVASLAGYNFIYGTNGVNIAAGLPSVFPNTIGTVYLYGTLGIEMPSDAYMKNIYPYWDGLTTPPDLNITGRYIIPNLAQIYVNLSNVKRIYMDSFAEIQDVKLINMSNGTISNANNIGGNGTISGYTNMSATNGTFTTLSNTNLIGSGSGSVSGYANGTFTNLSNTTLNNNRIFTSSILTSTITSVLANCSSLNTSTIVSPVYGTEFRIVNTLPGSSTGGSGPNAVSRLIAEKPSGVSTVAQLVAADTGATLASFKKDGTLTNLLLNASTIHVSSQSFTCIPPVFVSSINGVGYPLTYGSFTANSTQTLTTNVAISTVLDTVEAASGIALASASSSRVVVNSPGVYRFQASPQFDTSSGGQNTVDFWFAKNGNAVPRSASKMTIQNNGEVFSSVEIVLDMNTNDYVEVLWTSSDNNMTCSAFAAAGVIPAVPALILNAQKIA